MRTQRLRCCLALTVLLASAGAASAVILHSTGDPARNTTPPTGALTNSGWQYQGQWGAYLGTPISPKHFLAAGHVGGAVGDPFIFRGVTYITTAMADDPNSDLRIWRICGEFPDFAPVYDGLSELGQTLVVFGRGTQRGGPVVVSDLFGPTTKGWFWGPADGVQRWGANVVSAIINGDNIVPLTGTLGGSVGDMLQATFDANGLAEEAHLSVGDSSGGVFIQDGGVWKLAGINYGVEALFNTNNLGAGFLAAVPDKGGLYSGGQGNWQQMPDLPADVPSALYATRVASNLGWIRSVLQAPPPADPPPRLESSSAVSGPYAADGSEIVDAGARTFTMARPAQTRFFRLNGCGANRITSISIEGSNLVLRYE
jgi:hypothetical protein